MNTSLPGLRNAAYATACALLASGAVAQEATEATPAWAFETRYTVDSWRKLSGHSAAAYLDNVDLTLDVDGAAAFGAQGWRFFGYALYNNGHAFNDAAVGSLQGISNIESVHAFRLYELWGEWHAQHGLSVRAGLYDLNSEFDAMDTAGLFLNPSHGIGADYAQSGTNGPSIFPVTSLATRVAVEQGPWSVRAVVLEAEPGDPEHPDNTTVRWDADEGFLYALEANRTFEVGARAGLGYWRYSKKAEALTTARARSDGLYAMVESPTVELHGQWRAFARVGRAAPEVHAIERYVGAGVVWSGFMPSRPDDQLGIAVAHARVGDRWRSIQEDDTASHETILELTARVNFCKWFVVQPDVQYVANPGALNDAASTWVFGLRVESGFAFAR